MKVSRQRPTRRGRMAIAAAASALLLSSCSGGTPGVAAEVAGDRITDEEVDDFAEVLCALGGAAGGGPAAPSKGARFQSLQILLGNEIAAELTDVEKVDRAEVAASVEAASAARDTVPDDLLDTFDTVVEEFSRAQTAILQLGRESLRASGQEGEVSDDEAFNEGERLRTEYAKQADIEVDPRFGTLQDGVLRPGNGSLSVPVSDLAVQADEQEPPAELLDALPASQKCG